MSNETLWAPDHAVDQRRARNGRLSADALVGRDVAVDSLELISHWEDLDEWPPERQLHACYVTVADQPELRAAVERYQEGLAHLSGLDLILPGWLHMTIQGVRFIDELHPDLIADLEQRLDAAFCDVAPFEVLVERPVVAPDSLLMPVRPIQPVAAMRDQIRDLLGSSPDFGELFVLPGQDGDFDPHISIAYANGAVSRQAAERVIAACPLEPVPITVTHFSLMTLSRSDRKYHWEDEYFVRLTG